MTKLSNEEVEHVANLARLKVNDEDKEWYASQLGDIMTEVNKIIDVDINEKNIMITSSNNINMYSEDEIGEMLKTEEVLRCAKNTKGEYVVVPKVLND